MSPIACATCGHARDKHVPNPGRGRACRPYARGWMDGCDCTGFVADDVHALPVTASVERQHELERTCWCEPEVEFAGARWFVLHEGAIKDAKEASRGLST